ncbi:MAG: glutathione synthase [Hydrogenophilales bacterium]|nr:glutathione synthase [Hydrogenophilales bacterium]
MKLLFVADPLDHFKIHKDSTYAMMAEAAARGHVIDASEGRDLVWRGGRAQAEARSVHLTGRRPDWHEAGAPAWRDLADYDAVLMRKDPPFDQEYLYHTYLLELAERQGAKVFNRAASLRDFNEKLAIAGFPQFTVPTLVTGRAKLLRDFLDTHGDIILKPLNAMGGASVFRLRPGDANLSVIIETLTRHGAETVMAQRFIPEIKDGDKRILIIDGEAVPYSLARIPAPGETRGNLAAGGTGVALPLTARDAEIAATLGPVLKAAGIFLAGLDVIGDWLTEVNVTSPTCFREITEQTGFNVAGMFMDALERKVAG